MSEDMRTTQISRQLQYYRAHREGCRLRGLRYYYNHTEACNKRRRKYETEHREELTEKRKLYRQTKKGKEATLRAIRRYELKHPEKKRAWNKAQGIEIRPCEICGTSMNIHRHHPNPLAPLIVEFLCALHHKQKHAIIKEPYDFR